METTQSAIFEFETPGCNPDPGIAPGEPHPGGPVFQPAPLGPMLQYLFEHLPQPMEPHQPWFAPEPTEPTGYPV
jgi:hypothetical protein